MIKGIIKDWTLDSDHKVHGICVYHTDNLPRGELVTTSRVRNMESIAPGCGILCHTQNSTYLLIN